MTTRCSITRWPIASNGRPGSRTRSFGMQLAGSDATTVGCGCVPKVNVRPMIQSRPTRKRCGVSRSRGGGICSPVYVRISSRDRSHVARRRCGRTRAVLLRGRSHRVCRNRRRRRRATRSRVRVVVDESADRATTRRNQRVRPGRRATRSWIRRLRTSKQDCGCALQNFVASSRRTSASRGESDSVIPRTSPLPTMRLSKTRVGSSVCGCGIERPTEMMSR